jgi:diguanylate cyclase (GGDEF)-like protein
MAFFFGGLSWGVTTAIISLFTAILMTVMQMLGFDFPQMTPASAQPYTQSLVLIINFAVIAALSLVYEMTSQSVKRERDLEHRKFQQLARTDPLTGLANRRIFDETLTARIMLYSKLSPVRTFALCYLDLDKFKPINDQFGHDVGDEVLNAISTRMRSALRGADFIGRHGGDEFMMLLDSVQDANAAAALSQRFLQLVQEPIKTSAGEMVVGGSFGFALFPIHGSDTITLQKSADDAMYEAKRSHSGFMVYSPPKNIS